MATSSVTSEITTTQKISSLLLQNYQVHLRVTKQITKYKILRFLSSKLKTYYVVETESVIGIAKLLSILIKRSVGYLLNGKEYQKSANLVITDEKTLLRKMEEGGPYTFAMVVVMDEGLEKTEISEVIYHLWDTSTKQKFHFLFFSSDHDDRSHLVYNIDTPQSTIEVFYLKKDLNGDQLLDTVADRIITEYAELNQGCCIVVFIPGLEYEVGIKKRIYQLQDQVVSILKEDYTTLAQIEKSDRPNIILTNRVTDVNALSDVAVVIDLILEKRRGKYQYISKHLAEARARRVTLKNGSCFRMISKESFEKLYPYHFPEVIKQDYLILKLINSGIPIDQIHHLLGVSEQEIIQRLDLYRRMTLLNSKNQLQYLGKLHLNVNTKAQVFNFLNLWYNDKHNLFPAIVLAGLLEHGTTDYFKINRGQKHIQINRNSRKYDYYIREDDASTFLTLYSDIMEDFKGLPDLTRAEDIKFLKQWAEERNLDYDELREITDHINRIIDQMSQQNYKITLGNFDLNKTMKLAREYAYYTYTIVLLRSDGHYYDNNDNQYLFGDYIFHTLQQDHPSSIIVIEYLVSENNDKKRYIKLAINNNARIGPKPQDIDPYTIEDLDKNIKIGLEIFSKINLSTYIIEPTPTKTESVALMGPKYKSWFSSTRLILDSILLNGEVYTKAESTAINTKVTYDTKLTTKSLPNRDISNIFDITLSWAERGYHLIEKEFLLSHSTTKVIYIGQIRADFNVLLDLYPKISFTIFDQLEEAPIRDNIKNEYNVNLLKHQEHQGEIVISHLNDLNKTQDLIGKLQPKAALIRFDPKKDFKYYQGEIITVPFQPKESKMTYLRINQIKLVDYNYNKYLNRVYYHNLIIRQWHQFETLNNKAENKSRPQREDQAIDKCYDCAKEVDIHREYLNKYNKTSDNQMIRDEINNLSTVISRGSLYKIPHGVYPNFAIAVRRDSLINFKPSTERRKVRGRRMRY